MENRRILFKLFYPMLSHVERYFSASHLFIYITFLRIFRIYFMQDTVYKLLINIESKIDIFTHEEHIKIIQVKTLIQ